MEPTPQELQYIDEFAKWEDNLLAEVRGAVRVRLRRVEKGLFGDSHSVGDGVSELVFKDHPGTRIYFGRSGNNRVILLMGGNKRTQSRDIPKAKKMWRQINGN